MHNEIYINTVIYYFCLEESTTFLGNEAYTNNNGFAPMQKEAISCDLDNSYDNFNTPPPSFTQVCIPVDVEQHTKSTPTRWHSTIQNKLISTKLSQQIVLEILYEFLKVQKEMILPKNEKLKLLVEEYKERAYGSSLISSIGNI